MGKKYDFKYVVIGSGPSGSTVALKLAKAKKSVCLIEGRFFGGSNLNSRDVPFAVALDFAHHYHKLATYPELQHQEFSFNFPTIAARELSTVIAAGGNNKKIFEDAGVICLNGYANFLDEHTIAVGSKKISAEYFILATGARPKISEIDIAESVQYHTPETAIKARRLPGVVAIVGGGSTGCELAQYYAELGSRVVLLEASDRLLPREDAEVDECIADYFTHRLGIAVLLKSKVMSIGRDEHSDYLIFNYEGTEKMVRTEIVVLATGSEPVLDYGLENTKVKFKNTGIEVNKMFQTNEKNIFAVGDAIGGESSTDRAHYEGAVLASNLVSGSKNLPNYSGLVRVAGTYPEVAVVGLTEDDLIRRDRKYKKAIVKLDEITASKINGCNFGFVKVLADRTGHLLGASIVAPNASLIAGEFALALRHGLTTLELASMPRMINGLNEAVSIACKNLINNATLNKKHIPKKSRPKKK